MKSVTIDGPDGPIVSDDATTANSIDDATVASDPESSAVEPAPFASAAVSGEAAGPDSENNSVLELPQVLNLSNGSTANPPADGAAAHADGNDDDLAQSNQNGQDTADDDLAAAADQVGTLRDYEDQANRVPLGPIFFAPGFAIVRFPRPPLFNPLSRPPFGVPMATSPIILPPTSSGPFPSTSPMLMAPHIRTLGSFPGRGLMGLHR
jgi:hypothetical protein